MLLYCLSTQEQEYRIRKREEIRGHFEIKAYFTFHLHGKKYDLPAWSMMPDHVRVLIRTRGDLIRIIQLRKSCKRRWAMKNNKKYKPGMKIIREKWSFKEWGGDGLQTNI